MISRSMRRALRAGRRARLDTARSVAADLEDQVADADLALRTIAGLASLQLRAGGSREALTATLEAVRDRARTSLARMSAVPELDQGWEQ